MSGGNLAIRRVFSVKAGMELCLFYFLIPYFKQVACEFEESSPLDQPFDVTSGSVLLCV